MWLERESTSLHHALHKKVYCSDIASLMEDFEIEHKKEEWRQFIDFSKTRLKLLSYTVVTVCFITSH